MTTAPTRVMLAALLSATPAMAQNTNDPFPTPIAATDGVITVNFVEFATIPDINGEPARMMHMSDQPETRRLFVSDMRGLLYSLSYNGKTVTPYLDLRATTWGVSVQSAGSERGLQSFAFHPQFTERGTRGFGKFYTLVDSSNTAPPPDFVPGGGQNTHDLLLLEWSAKNPAAAAYDGSAPRVLIRFEHPFSNHNGGQLAFNPLASPGSAEYGLLYVGSADGGSGGDPMNLSQDLKSLFGKILRIDPLGSTSVNQQYGIPASNPFANDGNANTRAEIYASGVRNPQRLGWDSKTGTMYVADIGQNIVEEVSPVTAGANLGWNKWEGSFTFVNRNEVSLANPRSDPSMVYPVVEYGQIDPLLQSNSAATGVIVYRHTAIKQLANLLIFGDNPSGEIFYVHADKLPKGGQDAIRRVLLDDNGVAKTLLQLITAKNIAQGKKPATRADLRFGQGPNGQVFLMNKRDGTIRLLVPGPARKPETMGSRD